MNVTIAEKAKYIMDYYSALLTPTEAIAFKHARHASKLEDGVEGARRRQLYLKTKWLSDDPEVLAKLDKGYTAFSIACAERILKDCPEKVYFNLCPNCGGLARRPLAKQCRYCESDWH